MIYIYDEELNNTEIIDGLNVIILSPSFCWFKELELPTKSLSKAKKIADHMLSDRPEKYVDIAISKDNNKFKIYCYERKTIENIVKKLGKTNCKVYFVYELTDDLALLFNNDLLVEFLSSNKTLIKNKKPILKLNPNETKSTALLLSINIIFAMTIIMYSLNQYSTLSQIQTQSQNIKKDDKSNYEINSFIKTSKVMQKKSNKLKESLNLILKDKKNIELIEYKKNKFIVKESH